LNCRGFPFLRFPKNGNRNRQIPKVSRAFSIISCLAYFLLYSKEVEEQLMKKAYSIYQSPYKVGEVLEIDQSTVVKILKKI